MLQLLLYSSCSSSADKITHDVKHCYLSHLELFAFFFVDPQDPDDKNLKGPILFYNLGQSACIA